MSMDWVPMDEWGTASVVNPGTSGARSMWNLQAEMASGGAGLFDDADDMFIERIVGTISVANFAQEPTEPFITAMLRIMPLQADFTAAGQVPQLPWDPVTAIANPFTSGDLANLRFWWERYYTVETGVVERDPMFDFGAGVHPYWAHVDIRPKQAFGMRRNLWPCIVSVNANNDDTFVYRPRLRMLVKRNRR